MRQRSTIWIVCTVAMFMLCAGIVRGMNMWPSATDEMVEKAREEVGVIEMAEFMGIVEREDYDMIIDVREPEEFAEGHIPGAINIPRGLLEFEIWKNVGYPGKAETDGKIYVYCREGNRAFLCTKALKDLGFQNATAVHMKVDDWKYAGGTLAGSTGEGSVRFESDPSDYNMDYGST